MSMLGNIDSYQDAMVCIIMGLAIIGLLCGVARKTTIET